MDSLPSTSELDAEKLKRKFSLFVRAAWALLVPAHPLIEHFALDAVCDHLQAVTEGHIKKLIINIPPGLAKSTLVAVLWPVWEWANRPETQWMFATYAKDLTFRDAKRRRDLMNDPWYRERWGKKFSLTDEGVAYVKNTVQGHMFSTSTEGQTTGWRGDRLVLDDPQDPKGVESEIKRESTIEWLTRTWPTRINRGSPYAAEVLIQQRLHERDATGLYLLDGGWTHLKIPLEYDGKKYSTSIGYSDPRETKGESISERIYPKDDTEALKRRLGPYGTSGQLQQEPAPSEGAIIKAAWIRSYPESAVKLSDKISLPAPFSVNVKPLDHFRFCTIDPAATEKTTTKPTKQSDPDYFVIAAWCVYLTPTGPALMLLDLLRERLEGPDHGSTVQAWHDTWKFSIIGVESVAFQLTLFQSLKRRGLPVREMSTKEDAFIRIDGDKTARAYAATPLMADGRFFVPTYATWLGEYIRELTLYPNAAHDDMVDATTYAVAIAEKVKNGLFEGYQPPDKDLKPARDSVHIPDDNEPRSMYEGWGSRG